MMFDQTNTPNGGGEPDFDTMTPAQFEQWLPDLFATGSPNISTDPRLQGFLSRNPDCAALVRDLETIAQYASSLFEVQEQPSDAVWANIQKEIGAVSPELEAELD